MGAGTRHQRDNGIEDDADSLFQDYLSLNQWWEDAGVVCRFCERCVPTIDSLADIGVPSPDALVIGGEERLPRTHWVVGSGQGLVDALVKAKSGRDIDIALGQRADRLLVSEGCVRRTAVSGDELTADGVVITTGGFGANP